jgi:hypothetical protein
MLSDTLVTNEVKDSVGTEIEFERINSEGRTTVFQTTNPTPGRPHTLTIKHQESGSGVSKRRRSTVRFDKVIVGQVDTTRTETISAYVVGDFPVGNMTAYTQVYEVLANLMSFLASDGSGTTILYAGTGSGAKSLALGTI